MSAKDDRPLTYFLFKIFNTKLKNGKDKAMTRISKRKLIDFMVENDYVCMGGLIYDSNNFMVGKIVMKTWNSSEEPLPNNIINGLPIREVMKLLGSLDPSDEYHICSKRCKNRCIESSGNYLYI